MTEPLTVTVLDPQTMDELQPPCECRILPAKTPCPAPAAWAVTTPCDEGPRITLVCRRHLDEMLSGRTLCRRCADGYHAVVSVVRL